MARFLLLAPCCRTGGSYVESSGANSSHSLTWDKRIISKAAAVPAPAGCPPRDQRFLAAGGRARRSSPRAGPPLGPAGRLKVTSPHSRPAPRGTSLTVTGPLSPLPATGREALVTVSERPGGTGHMPRCGNVSGRTDRDNELMTPGTMLRRRSVVERCHGLASGHGNREPTRDQPREACRGRRGNGPLAPSGGATALRPARQDEVHAWYPGPDVSGNGAPPRGAVRCAAGRDVFAAADPVRSLAVGDRCPGSNDAPRQNPGRLARLRWPCTRAEHEGARDLAATARSAGGAGGKSM